MFKTLLTGSACLLIASPALANPVLIGEVRIGDVRDNRTDSTEYVVEYWDTAKFANFGLELQTKQLENEGSLDSTISVKAGPVLPNVYGFTPAAYVEAGRVFQSEDNYNFWGVGVKASKVVYGPVSASVGYRHREGFGSRVMNEDRVNGGISLALKNNYAVGAQYYRTRGTTNSDAVGVSLTRKF